MMARGTNRDLRDRGGDTIDPVAAGARLTVARDSKLVTGSHPVPAVGHPAAVLLERWRHLPPIDASALRRDMDDVIDATRDAYPKPGTRNER